MSRDDQQRYKRRKLREEKDVRVRTLRPADWKRRLELEQDDEAWLRFFFCDIFTYDFTLQQQTMIQAIADAIQYGGDQAIAASRGEGKTTIFETVLTKKILQGAATFAVLLAATGTKADDSLKTIKDALEDSGDFQGTEAAYRIGWYYPEVCDPVRSLEGAPQRAHSMTVSGYNRVTKGRYKYRPCKFTWCGNQIVLPNAPGSPSAGAIIATAGLEKEIRGIKKGTRRPDVIGIDDPDTEETVNSEEQAKKLENRIERGLARLGSQRRRIARVMLTTLQNRKCVSYKFTDPVQKPSWKPKRFRFLLKPPDRMDLWDEYTAMVATCLAKRDENGQPTDPYARFAHQFYLERQEIMDAGGEVANPNRFYGDVLPDGSRQEVSALQHYFNQIVAMGSKEAVATEYDNDPPEETGIVESGITPYRIQRQVSGVARRRIPDGCTILSQGIDVRKIALHWVVRAWRPEESEAWTGFVMDYGVTETNVQPGAAESAVDSAIIRALHDRREYLVDNPYTMADGQILEPEYSLVDSGWRTEAIYQFCDEAGLGWYPAQGDGRSSGCAAVTFHTPTKSTPTKLIGWGYYLAARPGSEGAAWLVHMDADHWKAWEHDRWMSDPQKPGGLFMWGETSGNPDRMSIDERAHHSYSRHICAEIEVEEPDKNGVMKRYWKAKSDNNHWLDASYRCDVAAAMAGVRLFGMPLPEPEDDGGGDEGPIVDLRR